MNSDNDYGFSLDIDDILAEFLGQEEEPSAAFSAPAAPQEPVKPAPAFEPQPAADDPFDFSSLYTVETPSAPESVPASLPEEKPVPAPVPQPEEKFSSVTRTVEKPVLSTPAEPEFPVSEEPKADLFFPEIIAEEKPVIFTTPEPAPVPAASETKSKIAERPAPAKAEASVSVPSPKTSPAEEPASKPAVKKSSVPAGKKDSAKEAEPVPEKKSAVRNPAAAEKPALRKQTVPASEKPASLKQLSSEKEEQPEDDSLEKDSRYKVSLNGTRVLAAFLCFALTIACLFWLPSHVFTDTPDTGAPESVQRLNMSGKLADFAGNLVSDSLGSFDDAKYIKKIYRIDESASSAPAPNPSCFGVTTDPKEVQAVVESASALLDGQTLSWNPDIEFFPNSSIRYYYDETILVIAWKEIVEGKCCTFAEIKLADGSQLRRKIADDTYGSAVQLYPTTMANQVNAVIAINGDFYAFRDHGITTYQRHVYRCKAWDLDSCFFTADGDMLFSHAGELTTKDEAQAFVDANDVIFGVAFGPILVENGELKYCESYLIGEINNTYSRSAIGMIDELHYFLMTINYDDGCGVTATVNQEAQFMYDKGCINAYALDGGQTATIVMQGETVNRVDWNCERTMSDIIYFATALPEGGN